MLQTEQVMLRGAQNREGPSFVLALADTACPTAFIRPSVLTTLWSKIATVRVYFWR